MTSIYINRDLSWIEFNRRVLSEAQDEEIPLLERCKFLAIVTSNLDEFISVRAAGISQQARMGMTKPDFSGYKPEDLLRSLMKRARGLVAEQYRTYREIVRGLAAKQVHFAKYEHLNERQKQQMDDYFYNIVYPVLTPMAVDQTHPFPLVHSLGLYLAVMLRREDEPQSDNLYFAIVQVPAILPRLIPVLPRVHSAKKEFILLEHLIKRHIHSLFNGYVPLEVSAFRLTRNADLALNEEEAEDLLEEMEKELRRRRWGFPIRLEVERGMHDYALAMLMEEFALDGDIFKVDGPIDLSYFMRLPELAPDLDRQIYPEIEPVYPAELRDSTGEDWFKILRRKDMLLHHPYESFDAVLDFLNAAARDPSVLAIKMTLYRIGSRPPLIPSLVRAAEAGKQVTVLVELRARFDEERNIAWARELEKAGCHVVYGLVGLKTHAKMLLVVRREQESLRRYVHISTGNYNNVTAKLYTDLGLLTADEAIGEDVSALFNVITGYSAPPHWRRLAVAPSTMKTELVRLIRREAENARQGRPARMVIKVNSLSNQEMVDELYAASQAGVSIDLIVRGICCLRPGVSGLSDNIRVISIIDRFLEHSRIFYFEHAGKPEVWLSSADWMTRNLVRRVELMCPVNDPDLRQSLIRMLEVILRDNVKARRLLPDGTYELRRDGSPRHRSQFEFMSLSWKEPD